MDQDKQPVGRHVFCFNPHDNGGEALTLTTDFFANADGQLWTNQRLALQSYSNACSIDLYGACLVPEALRRLANELDAFAAQHGPSASPAISPEKNRIFSQKS